MTRLDRAAFVDDSRVVAPRLLNTLLVRTVDGERMAGRIVEVEAYAGADDPGSHAHRGPTPRTTTMFGPPGGLYVYFTYGMHWCANVVCRPEGEASAVLLRALAPTEGGDAMWRRRPVARRERDLCSGPAKLCQALGIDGACDGLDLTTGRAGVWLEDDGVAPPDAPLVTTRIGLRAGADLPWRWAVPGDPNVSRAPRAHPVERSGAAG